MSPLILRFLGCVSIVALSPPRVVAQRLPGDDSARIQAAARAFSAAYVGNDTAGLGQTYSDSAVLLPPGREIRGRAAIQRYFAWSAPYRQLAHSLTPTALHVYEGVAIDVGTWSSTSQRGEDPPTTASDRYLVTWVRESDGQWRILYDMWHRPTPPR